MAQGTEQCRSGGPSSCEQTGRSASGMEAVNSARLKSIPLVVYAVPTRSECLESKGSLNRIWRSLQPRIPEGLAEVRFLAAESSITSRIVQTRPYGYDIAGHSNTGALAA